MCPLCGSPKTRFAFSCPDHLVTGEEFPLHQCNDCQFLYSGRLPSEADAQKYYDSPSYTPHATDRKNLMMRTIGFCRTFIRQPIKRTWVRKWSKKRMGTLIDIGSGTGEFAVFMQKSGWAVTCIEPNQDARNFCASQGLTVFDTDRVPTLPDHSFNVVTLWHVLEHVYDIHGTMQTIRRLLQPDGTAFIALPNYSSKEASWYGRMWTGYEMPRHPSHFSPATFAHLASMYDMEIVALRPFVLDAFYLSILSEQHRKGWFISALFHGLASAIVGLLQPKLASSVLYVIRPTSSTSSVKN
jgi:2-polyprenyl-3-methyl-5-hydroxy-6-metoxy-1,4-benzoquinol methylase